MFGLNIFVRVQTFWRVPPVLPCNFCHPSWNINQIVFQKDSFHKKEIYFLLLYIYLQISCERCATYELLLNLPQYCILSWDTINRHNISTSNILMGAVFFAFSARKGLYLSLFLGKENRVLKETSWIYFLQLHAPHVDDRESRDRIISWEIQYLTSTWIPRYTDPHVHTHISFHL